MSLREIMLDWEFLADYLHLPRVVDCRGRCIQYGRHCCWKTQRDAEVRVEKPDPGDQLSDILKEIEQKHIGGN